MWIVIWIVLIVLGGLYGRGILGVLYGRRQSDAFTLADDLLVGGAAVVGLAQAAHLCGVFLRMSFLRCTVLFGGMAALLAFAALAVCFLKKSVKRSASGYPWGKAEKIELVIFGLVVLSQVVFIIIGTGISLEGDMMVETVGSFLHTDGIYQVNPMTGSAYEGGIPVRLKILCLPSLYGMLCRITGSDPGTMVWTVAPLVTLVCCYGAFYSLGRCLFPGDVKRQMCFLTVVALLMWTGTYLYGMDGFGLLRSGWRGVAIRNCVLVPWMLSLCLRRKRLLVLLCIVLEACMVWTLYGMGVCFLAAIVFMVCSGICGRAQKARDGRERGNG